MLSLENTYYLFFLLIIPLLIILQRWYLSWQIKKQAEFGDLAAVQKLVQQYSVQQRKTKFTLFILGIFFLIIALVNPKLGNRMQNVKAKGVEIVFAIDVSKSMNCADIAPSRLDKAKQIVSDIVSQLKTDRIGIVAYASNAFPILPMTTDYSVAKMYIKSLNTNMISSQGTGIKKAIEGSVSFLNNPKANKVIVLLSDGEDHEDDASSIADFAKSKKVKIITIGIGTEKGGNITETDEFGQIQLKTDNEGKAVVTKLNEQILVDIAKQTSGNYISANQGTNLINEIQLSLSRIEKDDFKTIQTDSKQSQYQWFLAVGLLLLMIEFFIYRKN